MKRQQRYNISEQEFESLDSMDRLIRDHNFQAQIIGNELMRAKMKIALKHDKDLKRQWENKFVDIGIDWKKKELVVSPTMDPEAKAREAADAIERHRKGNGINTQQTDTTQDQ